MKLKIKEKQQAMTRFFKTILFRRALRHLMLGLVLAVLHQSALAQHGHPLVGTWSGEWKAADGQIGRVLLVLKFDADQVISGNIIEGTVRAPITEGTLDPDTWTVTLKAEQKDKSGATVPIQIQGVIENLGSITERAIVGTWQKGNTRSDLRVVIN
jgi:hypothetical protein